MQVKGIKQETWAGKEGSSKDRAGFQNLQNALASFIIPLSLKALRRRRQLWQKVDSPEWAAAICSR